MLLRGWVLAGDLRVGDSVRLRDGSYALVEATETRYDPQVMYNVTVAEAHTYFVGDDGCTVHNADCSKFVKRVQEKWKLLTGGKVPLKEQGPELPEGVYWENISELTHGNPPDQIWKINRAKEFLKEGWDPNRAVGIEIMSDGKKVVVQGNHRLSIVKDMGYGQVPARILLNHCK